MLRLTKRVQIAVSWACLMSVCCMSFAACRSGSPAGCLCRLPFPFKHGAGLCVGAAVLFESVCMIHLLLPAVRVCTHCVTHPVNGQDTAGVLGLPCPLTGFTERLDILGMRCGSHWQLLLHARPLSLL